MEFESKTLSRSIQDALYYNHDTLGTAESCTGGRIAEAIIATPGASNYFKGGIISYTNEVKEQLLGVSHEALETHTAVSEEVARQMVVGACKTLNCNYAIAATGVAGPTGGTAETPVGTIWLAWGSTDDVQTFKLTEDFGRDINLAIATNKALRLFLDYYKEKFPTPAE
jgi:nicotinamide-nucleotide amidase